MSLSTAKNIQQHFLSQIHRYAMELISSFKSLISKFNPKTFGNRLESSCLVKNLFISRWPISIASIKLSKTEQWRPSMVILLGKE